MRTRWTAVAAAALVALAACGGDDGADGGDTAGEEAAGGGTAAGGTAAGTATGGGGADGDGDGDGATGVSCEPGATDGDLVLYNWSEYIDPELVEAFEQEYGVSVTEDFYPSNEELLAKVQAGGAGYDVIVPSDYMAGIMREEGMLLALDRDAITNAGNIAEDFRDPPFDPGLEYTMPYQWGTTGLGVDLAVVGDDPPATWGLIFDEQLAGDYTGRISMLDDPRESMAAALAYLGYDINTTDETELQEASDTIAAARDRLAAFDSDQFEDLLLQGETAVAHGWNGDFFAAFDESDAWDGYTYLIPEEGGVRWVDVMAILADAPHPCTAHTFIDFILDAENGAQLTNWNFYASPNAAAEDHIDPEILEDPAIYPPPEVIENLNFLRDTGDAELLYNDLFTQAKS